MDMLQSKLTYNEFIEVIEERIDDMLGDEAWIERATVLKNNSIELDGLTFHEGEGRVCPTVYLNDFYELYEEGKPLDSICDAIIRVFRECEESVSGFENLDFSRYESCKDDVILRIVNAKMNKDLLAKMPHIRIYDLAVIFVCLVRSSEYEQGTVRITNELMEQWEITTEELFERAKHNTSRLMPYRLTDIVTTLETLIRHRIASATDSDTVNEAKEQLDLLLDPAFTESMRHKMYVLTNDIGVGGAATLLYDGVTEKIREELGCDYFIIPSSVSEIIIVPDDESTDIETLRAMVREVNETGVPMQEILSDEVYHYPENNFKIQ